jgi:ribosomal protein L40E
VATVQRLAGGILFVLVGLLFIGLGVNIWEMCTHGFAPGVTANCSAGPPIVIGFGTLALVVGAVAIVQSVYSPRPTIYPAFGPSVPPPLINPVVVQQTVVQQTVEVRCRYCGSLNPVTATKCAACGAAL